MSRLIHYEGKTSGTSTSGGVKAYQLVNTGKLFLRWRDLLDRHKANGEAAFYEREREVRRRILVVDATSPTPGEDAGSVQTVLALRTCLEAGYKPYFIPEHNYLFQPGITEDLQKLGVECVYAPFARNFDDYIQRYGRLFDAVLVYRMTVLGSIIDSIRKYAPQASLLYHVADLHHLREQREALLLGDEEALAAANRTREIELGLVARADCTITHSQFEADMLAKEVPHAPVVVWPLAVSHRGTERGFAERRDLCFLGGYRHAPNVDAVRYFVDAIWPLIKQQQPDLRFIIAGANPTAEIEALARDDIIVRGRVDDLAELFDPARLFVAPLRYGAGVKGKILSALSHGIPIVSTQVGVEGSGLEHEKHLLVADDPGGFARAVLRLYKDKRLWKRLSHQGQIHVRNLGDPAGNRAILTSAIDRAHRRRLRLDA